MYENYSSQSLPSKEYRALLGSAICAFNSNNNFIIENILKFDSRKQYDWFKLIDNNSRILSTLIEETITKNSSADIAELFRELIDERNRIVHSFQITDKNGDQKLATKERDGGRQWVIEEKYLLDFIKKNGELNNKLHKLRGY